jgi:hypothetical protein
LEAERPGGLEVDHQLVLGRHLHGQVSGLLALEDAIDVTGCLPTPSTRGLPGAALGSGSRWPGSRSRSFCVSGPCRRCADASAGSGRGSFARGAMRAATRCTGSVSGAVAVGVAEIFLMRVAIVSAIARRLLVVLGFGASLFGRDLGA